MRVEIAEMGRLVGNTTMSATVIARAQAERTLSNEDKRALTDGAS